MLRILSHIVAARVALGAAAAAAQERNGVELSWAWKDRGTAGCRVASDRSWTSSFGSGAPQPASSGKNFPTTRARRRSARNCASSKRKGLCAMRRRAILLLALIGTLCLRTRSASARHWVLAVGVVSAGAAPALHVLPILPVVRVVPADAGVLGPAVASEAVAAVASDDVVGRLVVTIWLVGAVASVGVLLVGLARLRSLRASSSRVTDGPWHRAVHRPRAVVRPKTRRRSAVRPAAGTGGDVGLAAAGRHAAGVGVRVVRGADARRAAARACARAPRRLDAADAEKSTIVARPDRSSFVPTAMARAKDRRRDRRRRCGWTRRTFRRVTGILSSSV